MSIVELFVGLKIPDTTAITALHTLQRMGYDIKKLKRQVYYRFDVKGDAERFAKKANNVDILVNANKNTFSNHIDIEEGAVYVIVKDRGDTCQGLISTLTDRLGLKGINSMERGVLWVLFVDSEEIAREIANNLLHNENYQQFQII